VHPVVVEDAAAVKTQTAEGVELGGLEAFDAGDFELSQRPFAGDI
jgi:hypothetical protein